MKKKPAKKLPRVVEWKSSKLFPDRLDAAVGAYNCIIRHSSVYADIGYSHTLNVTFDVSKRMPVDVNGKTEMQTQHVTMSSWFGRFKSERHAKTAANRLLRSFGVLA